MSKDDIIKKTLQIITGYAKDSVNPETVSMDTTLIDGFRINSVRNSSTD